AVKGKRGARGLSWSEIALKLGGRGYRRMRLQIPSQKPSGPLRKPHWGVGSLNPALRGCFCVVHPARNSLMPNSVAQRRICSSSLPVSGLAKSLERTGNVYSPCVPTNNGRYDSSLDT